MDKTEKQLRMMEHPQQYCDEQWQELLADEEYRELYETMRLCADAFAMADAREKIVNGIVSEEWAKFEARHFEGAASRTAGLLKKIAASLVGVLMLTGIAYAAVQWWESSPGPSQGEEVKWRSTAQAVPRHQTPALTEGLEDASRVFENEELHKILDEVATFYQCKTVYRNEMVKHVRLYFTWDKTKPLDDVVATFNKFERFHIVQENQQLIVE